MGRPVNQQPPHASNEAEHPLNKKTELFTSNMVLLGNGKSRDGLELEQLRAIGTIIGCNAIYRDFDVDILIAIDAKMINEIKAAGYTRDDKNTIVVAPQNRRNVVPGGYIWNATGFNTSGGYAMMMIQKFWKPEKCYMFGMDGYPGNVYDGTRNYAAHTLVNFNGVLTRYRNALSMGNTQFINVNEQDTWQVSDCENYKFIHIDEFKQEFKL